MVHQAAEGDPRDWCQDQLDPDQELQDQCTCLEGEDDLWTSRLLGTYEHLKRVHKRKRTRLFTTDRAGLTKTPINIDDLGMHRITKVRYDDGTEEELNEVLETVEESQRIRPLRTGWTGETIFPLTEQARQRLEAEQLTRAGEAENKALRDTEERPAPPTSDYWEKKGSTVSYTHLTLPTTPYV